MVWGEPHIVTVYRKSETVYEAIGNYMAIVSVVVALISKCLFS